MTFKEASGTVSSNSTSSSTLEFRWVQKPNSKAQSTRQDVTLIWTRRDFLYVAGKSKFLVDHFLMTILSRSWSFHIRTWTRNTKLPRLIRFISFNIWHRYAPRNTTRNVTTIWISQYTEKNTSEAFSSGHTKIVDFAHFYWFGQFLLISGCTRLNLLISAAYSRGCPWAAKNVDFISTFLHQINKNQLEINYSSPWI